MIWDDYVAAHPEHAQQAPPVEQLGDSPEMADRLLDLVVQGRKRATAGMVDDYAADGEPLPVVGDHWIVTDGRGVERVIVRYTDVRVGPLASVDDTFAWDEGEGDRTRDTWLADHRAFADRRCAAQHIAVPLGGVDVMAAVFQRFDVVWPLLS